MININEVVFIVFYNLQYILHSAVSEQLAVFFRDHYWNLHCLMPSLMTWMMGQSILPVNLCLIPNWREHQDGAATAKDLDSLEKWNRRNLVMFKQRKVRGLASRKEYAGATLQAGIQPSRKELHRTYPHRGPGRYQAECGPAVHHHTEQANIL